MATCLAPKKGALRARGLFATILAALLVAPLSAALGPAGDAPPGATDPASPASLDLGDLGPLDLRDLPTVFAAVFDAMPSDTTVYPSENYQYIRFHSGDRALRGNLRLAVGERDEGLLNFAFYEHLPRGVPVPGALPAQHRLLGPSDGVALTKVDDDAYTATFAGKTVTFRLHELDQSPPSLWQPRSSEAVVFRTLDESRFPFVLVFDRAAARFLWVLDEERPVPDALVPVAGAQNLLVGQRSGFAFLAQPDVGRKVLVAVHGPNVRENNYYDGPFDQLADNDVGPGSRLQEFIERAYPFARGRVDLYGQFTDQPGARVAIAPYGQWETPAQLRGLAPSGPSAQSGVCSGLSPVHLPFLSRLWGEHGLFFSNIGIAGVQHDAATSRTCTGTSHAERVSGAIEAIPHEKALSDNGAHKLSLSLQREIDDKLKKPLSVWHEPDTSRGCTDPPFHLGAASAVSRDSDLVRSDAVQHDTDTSQTCTAPLQAGDLPGVCTAVVCPGPVFCQGLTIHIPSTSGCLHPLDPLGVLGLAASGAPPGADGGEGGSACPLGAPIHIPRTSLTVDHNQVTSFGDPAPLLERLGVVHQEETSGGCTHVSGLSGLLPAIVHDTDASLSGGHSVQLSMAPSLAVQHETGTSKTCTDPPIHFGAVSRVRELGLPYTHDEATSGTCTDPLGLLRPGGACPTQVHVEPMSVETPCIDLGELPGGGTVCPPIVHIPSTSEVHHAVAALTGGRDLGYTHNEATSETCTDTGALLYIWEGFCYELLPSDPYTLPPHEEVCDPPLQL